MSRKRRKETSRLIALLKKHLAKGGTTTQFASLHRKNPSTVWCWAIEEGLIQPRDHIRYRQASGDELASLKAHLLSGGTTVTFAGKVGVNKSTAYRWAIVAGLRTEKVWSLTEPLRLALAKALVLNPSEYTPAKFAAEHNLSTALVHSWARSLGFTAELKWADGGATQ